MASDERPPAPWWHGGVIYQIYPRSFQDSNGDGIGDLHGIVSRLDYLNNGSEHSLGIDAIWLSPTFPSPMKDFGYDVSDYRGVHPDFGDLAAMDELIAACHARGIRLLLDYVPNHSSDQHPWFLASRSSRSDAKRDWYYWRDAAPGGGPPNNWLSAFGGGAWTWDGHTGQYYLHSFLKEQPDLNWRNPEVVHAIFDAMRFWLDRGVDGFRMDVLWLLIKDDQYRDNPPNLPLYTADRPEVHAIVAEMRGILASYPGRNAVLIGEIYLPLRDLIAYYGFDPNAATSGSPALRGPVFRGAHMPFNFHLILTPWNADRIATL